MRDAVNHRGLFIVLEGGEGVGKTTQWSRLSSLLKGQGHDVLALREPGGTPAGDALRALLLDPASHLTAEAEALLFSASRAQLVATVIKPALAEGKIVLVDRFVLSTYAYQGAGRGLPVDALRAITRVATGGLVPSLTLLLGLPVETALGRAFARSEADRMERETAAFHERVAHAFEVATTSDWQASHPEVGPVARVDASGDVDVVLQRIHDVLSATFPERFATHHTITSTAPAAVAALDD